MVGLLVLGLLRVAAQQPGGLVAQPLRLYELPPLGVVRGLLAQPGRPLLQEPGQLLLGLRQRPGPARRVPGTGTVARHLAQRQQPPPAEPMRSLRRRAAARSLGATASTMS